MALKYAKKGVLAKTEVTPGTSPDPTAAEDSLETIGFDVTPIESTVVDLEQDRSTLGAAEQVSIGNAASCTFGTYIAGRGTSNGGSAIVQPGYDAVIQGCGFQGRSQEFDTWAVGDVFAVGDITKVSTDGFICILPHTAASTNNPTSGADTATYWKQIDAWAANTDYDPGYLVVGNSKVYRCHTRHTAAAGSGPTSANGGVYWHEYGNSYIYRPDSDNPKTVYFDANLDGNKHVITSARGTMTGSFTAGALPQYQFTYQGFYVDPTASKALNYDYGRFETPRGVTKRDTPNAFIHGQKVVMNSLNFDCGNQIEIIDEINAESIELNNRSVSGNAVIEMPKVDVFNWFTQIKGLVKDGLYLQHGPENNRVELYAPRVSLAPPSITENKGRYMLDIPLRFLPDKGDDDIEIRTL